MLHVSAITCKGASRCMVTNSLMLKMLSQPRCTRVTFVPDGTHQKFHLIIIGVSTLVSPWHQGYFTPVYRVFAQSVCSREVTACFISASAANRTAVKCFISSSNRRKLLGTRSGPYKSWYLSFQRCRNHSCDPFAFNEKKKWHFYSRYALRNSVNSLFL